MQDRERLYIWSLLLPCQYSLKPPFYLHSDFVNPFSVFYASLGHPQSMWRESRYGRSRDAATWHTSVRRLRWTRPSGSSCGRCRGAPSHHWRRNRPRPWCAASWAPASPPSHPRLISKWDCRAQLCQNFCSLSHVTVGFIDNFLMHIFHGVPLNKGTKYIMMSWLTFASTCCK